MAEDEETLATSVEALIFAADRPSTVAQMRKLLPELSATGLARIVENINATLAHEGRPYEIVEVNGGYQFRTRPEYGALIRSARPERRVRLSRAALETLAVVAYRQPLTRAELEELRCVDCGAVLRTLLERDLVRIVGRRDAPGRPALYASTSRFLETFGLRSLRDLPDLREVRAMVEIDGTPVELGAGASEDAYGEDAQSEDAQSEDAQGEAAQSEDAHGTGALGPQSEPSA